MLSTKIAENKYHAATKHSYRSVAIDKNYVDASTQPTSFKFYPKFYRRFPLINLPIYDFIRLSSAITFNKLYRDGSTDLRVNPSAGALYPTEIYVQLRGVKGTIDGIYHLEVANNCLTLIYELIDDGIESYVLPNYIVKGTIFLVSCVYYRSSWKYKNRSLRYCFLDSGHHLSAIEAAAYLYQKNLQIIFDFDKLALNEALGFENKEWVTAGVIAGELKEKSVRRLRSPIPFVCGTDYFEPNAFVEAGYRDIVEVKSDRQLLLQPQFEYEPEKFLTTILNRRSARKFTRKSISLDNFFEIIACLNQPIPTESFEELEIYLIVNRVEGMVAGVYRLNIPPNSLEKGGSENLPISLEKWDNMALIKAGDFSDRAGYLCINQAIARDSAVTLFFASNYKNYQTALQLAGSLGQRLYLVSHYLELECSGIAAYYDDETQAFLGIDRDILYAMAIGVSI